MSTTQKKCSAKVVTIQATIFHVKLVCCRQGVTTQRPFVSEALLTTRLRAVNKHSSTAAVCTVQFLAQETLDGYAKLLEQLPQIMNRHV